MRWLSSITVTMDVNLSKLQEIVKDREGWRAAVHGVTESDRTFGLNNNKAFECWLDTPGHSSFGKARPLMTMSDQVDYILETRRALSCWRIPILGPGASPSTSFTGLGLKSGMSQHEPSHSIRESARIIPGMI